MLFIVRDIVVFVVFFRHVLHLDDFLVYYLNAFVFGSGTGFKHTVMDAVSEVDEDAYFEEHSVVNPGCDIKAAN